jgi:hypothetical protein
MNDLPKAWGPLHPDLASEIVRRWNLHNQMKDQIAQLQSELQELRQKKKSKKKSKRKHK